MDKLQKEVKRRIRILEHAVLTGNAAKTCRYFGISRLVFYLWRAAWLDRGAAGLGPQKLTPKSHPNQTPDEAVEKALYLRRKYHLGANPDRLVPQELS